MKNLAAIDVHAHYGDYKRVKANALILQFFSAGAAEVAARARAAGIETTVVSPLRALLPRGRADAARGNREAARVVARTPGLRQWVVVNPRQPETFRQARTMLKQPWCAGIKIHPEEHGYPIRRHGRALFALAAEANAVILTHSGEANSLPADFVPFADAYPTVRLILGHMGNGGAANRPDLQVRAVRKARRDNVFTDTSSAQSMLSGLLEWAVAEIGAERILFGTDSPLYFAAAQRARIEQSNLTARQKRLILRENARRVFAEKLR